MINLNLRDAKVFGTDNGGFVSEYGIRGRMVELTDDCLERVIKHVVDSVQEGQALKDQAIVRLEVSMVPVILPERRISV